MGRISEWKKKKFGVKEEPVLCPAPAPAPAPAFRPYSRAASSRASALNYQQVVNMEYPFY